MGLGSIWKGLLQSVGVLSGSVWGPLGSLGVHQLTVKSLAVSVRVCQESVPSLYEIHRGLSRTPSGSVVSASGICPGSVRSIGSALQIETLRLIS